MDRHPAVAGLFYPSNPDNLRRILDELFLRHPLGPKSLPTGDPSTIALVAPHAGYVYSGPCAAHAYLKIRKADTIVIAGPNHTGRGEPISVRPDGKWITPIGSLEVDKEFVDELVRIGPVEKDYYAHIDEHSIEVHLPFIIYAYTKLKLPMPKIVPIVIGYQLPDAMAELASAILEAANHLGRDIIFIASSDLNHYEPHKITVAKDLAVLGCIEKLDVECLYDNIQKLNVSVCGPGPISTAIYITKRLGGKAKVLAHMTSGDVTQDTSAVVGYASIRFYKE